MILQKKNQLVTRKDGDLAKLIECDNAFEKIDLNFFITLLQQDESISVRTRCVCILADIGDNSVVPVLSEILKMTKLLLSDMKLHLLLDNWVSHNVLLI